MSSDWYTRIVLTVIAGALVALAVQGQQPSAGPDVGEGRFRLTPLPVTRMAIRMDTETGEAWTAMFPDLRIWTKIAETPAELLERAPTPAAAPFEMKIERRGAPESAPQPAEPPAAPSQP